MLVQPDGLIAITGTLGGGGCFTMPIEWLTDDGSVATSIDADYDRTHSFP